MAHLGSKTSDGKVAFVKYITDNPKFSTKTEYLIENKVSNEPILSSQGKTLTSISEGGIIHILNKKAIKKNFSGGRSQLYAKIRVVKGTKRISGLIRASAIRKPTVGRSNVMLSEDAALRDLNNLIQEIGAPITIRVKETNGSGVMIAKDVVGAANVRGTPKADFALINSKKKEVFWISHKKGGGASAFQQYSGVSEKAGRIIYKHKEVQRFLSEAVSLIQNGRLLSPLMRKVEDKRLIKYAIYGPDYGKSFGKDHVNLIGQGKPKLKPYNRDKEELTYILEFDDGYHTSGDLNFKDGYLPVIGATYRAGRSFNYDSKRYTGARIGIYPQQILRGRKGLITL